MALSNHAQVMESTLDKAFFAEAVTGGEMT